MRIVSSGTVPVRSFDRFARLSGISSIPGAQTDSDREPRHPGMSVDPSVQHSGPHRRKSALRLAGIVLLVMAGSACGESPPPESAETPSAETVEVPATAAPTLEGGYRFSRLNGQLPSVEYPASSGMMLETGTLDIDPAGRFARTFIFAGPLGSEPSGQAGSYRVSADTIYFAPEAASQVPVVFRYELADNELRLHDSAGNLWSYLRRPS